MNMQSQFEPVVDRLQTALKSELFPTEWHQWGTRLLDHLRKPVQVAVMGLPGSGKSTLINMMLDRPVIPRIENIPVIEIAHGFTPRALFELEDGTCLRRNGQLTERALPPSAIRARMELADDALLRQNFVEVTLTGGFGHQVSMVNWVVQWADIILWCTHEFGDLEQKLWAGVTDDIKDHSFLVLTMADRQMMRGILQDRIASLEPVVSEEFLCLYPIATEQAIAARSAGPEVNQTLWKSSGGKALLAGVSSQVDNGRTADMDQAQMLLNRFAPDLRPDLATAQSMPVGPVTAKPEGKKTSKLFQSGPTKNNGAKTLEAALEFLQNAANEMLTNFAQNNATQTDRILESCVETANTLAQRLQDIDPEDLIGQNIQSDAQEGTEMMLLFQLERDEDAAVDAVTLLLQLKKEIAEKVRHDDDE